GFFCVRLSPFVELECEHVDLPVSDFSLKPSIFEVQEPHRVDQELLECPDPLRNVWFYQKAKYNAWTWLLRKTGNGFNAETRTFHLPPEEWDALININESISTFRKGGLLHEDLMEAIFANIVATGRYATGPARDDFIDTTTSDVAADLNMLVLNI
ncbi:hypothetical protein GIB67_015690, partial [Kingdonia uniflora]